VLFSNYWIVVDSGGGLEAATIAKRYIAKNICMEEARRLGIDQTIHVEENYVVNLDSDVRLPKGYLQEAFQLLQDPKVAAASSTFTNKDHQGVLEFGCSVWRKNLLANLYDWETHVQSGMCECAYMWRKVKEAGFKVMTLTRKPEHLSLTSARFANL
jgi:hypothetical protein